MSRRKKKPGWGQGKHRKARVQRFNSKHPERVGRVANKKAETEKVKLVRGWR